VYRFQRSAPIDPTIYPDPYPDRSGPPLSQGFVLVLINTVAAEYCHPETLAFLDQVHPTAWYHGQNFESILNHFEAQDPALPIEIGKNIYYTLRSQFAAMGIKTPTDVIQTLPAMWQHVTRGDSGEWRDTLLGPGRARLEAEQPYNCLFEQGAVQGALEAFDASNVQIAHSQCMRRGAPCCVFEISWNE
jgi:hypothetical protein